MAADLVAGKGTYRFWIIGRGLRGAAWLLLAEEMGHVGKIRTFMLAGCKGWVSLKDRIDVNVVAVAER